MQIAAAAGRIDDHIFRAGRNRAMMSATAGPQSQRCSRLEVLSRKVGAFGAFRTYSLWIVGLLPACAVASAREHVPDLVAMIMRDHAFLSSEVIASGADHAHRVRACNLLESAVLVL